MITLYAFGRVYPGMMGEGRDLRAQWALEETGLPYRVHALDYIAGELDGPAYSRLSCFHQVPVIDDDGFIVGESGAVLLYIAEKAGKLIPADFAGRTRVVQWCFAALATVLRQVRNTDLIEPYPRLKAYYARALARPAWQRTLSLCAERQGVTLADIR